MHGKLFDVVYQSLAHTSRDFAEGHASVQGARLGAHTHLDTPSLA